MGPLKISCAPILSEIRFIGLDPKNAVEAKVYRNVLRFQSGLLNVVNSEFKSVGPPVFS